MTSAYRSIFTRKDLEEPIISVEHKNLWGGFILLK
ncbi:NifT/FixU family protein, partial [Rhizobium johnstonii]